jgi:hypothetical protein
VNRAASVAAAAFILATAGSASAQDPLPGRFEVGGGLAWIGSASAGSNDATESTASGGSSTIFSTSTRLAGVPGIRIHVAVRVTRALDVEGLATYSKPSLETSVSNDIEHASAVTATESVTQYVIGGGVLWYLPALRASRLRLFAAGHAAYLRQLHESDTLAATGQSYQVAGGVKWMVPLRRKSWIKAFGIRADGGVAARRKGVFFNDTARFSPVAAASLAVRF